MEKEKIIDIIDDLLQDCYNDLFEYVEIKEEKAKIIYNNIKLYTMKLKDRLQDEEEKTTLESYIKNLISCYDEEYQKEIGMDLLDNEDINNIIFNILDNNNIKFEIQQELEEYCNYNQVYLKKVRG